MTGSPDFSETSYQFLTWSSDGVLDPRTELQHGPQPIHPATLASRYGVSDRSRTWMGISEYSICPVGTRAPSTAVSYVNEKETGSVASTESSMTTFEVPSLVRAFERRKQAERSDKPSKAKNCYFSYKFHMTRELEKLYNFSVSGAIWMLLSSKMWLLLPKEDKVQWQEHAAKEEQSKSALPLDPEYLATLTTSEKVATALRLISDPSLTNPENLNRLSFKKRPQRLLSDKYRPTIEEMLAEVERLSDLQNTKAPESQ